MDGTRGTIVQGFERLLNEKPVNKITVKDIAEKCGINRNTFYYHFQDIPTLLEEIMEEKADQLIANHYQADEPMECIRPLIRYGMKHRNAVLHVYHYVPRETFLIYVNRIASRLAREYFSSAASGVPDSNENAEALICFYKCAMVGLVLDWLDGGLEADMEALTQRICALLKGSGREALSRI